ncbi:sensor histidine kinase [Amnibacterium endophyticum]|uniref:histidine kinase n=1 Tax=Amnibacterium endophyticum TaxID=2109337 RepID=A0ABW4LHH2_9MICO
MLRDLTRTERAVDLLIALAYAVVFAAGPVTSGAWDPGAVVPALLLAGALALRRLSPPVALGIAWAAALVQMALDTDPNLLDAAIPPVVYACAAYGSRATRWSAFVSALVGGGIAGAFAARHSLGQLLRGDPTEALRSFLIIGSLAAVTLLLAWTIGVLVATSRQSRSNRQRAVEADQQTAAEQERTRIARDMHDVVAHSLAVVIAQSDGARLLRRTDPEAVDEALETIGGVSRAALADVRVLLQQLRYEGTTSVQPGLADLPALLDQFRTSGLDVEAHLDEAASQTSTSVQLAAFRIVQESLTNALRHGDRGRPASVVLTRTGHGLEVEVRSALDPERPPRPSSGGHGLIGMRERASAVQGDLKAGPDGEHFRVRAFLPAGATAALPVVGARG